MQDFRRSFHTFSQKWRKTPNMTRFTESEKRQKEENQQTMIIVQSVLEVVRIHQHARLQAISSTHSPDNAWKLQI